MKLLVLHGPNLNLLGIRESGAGTQTYAQLNEYIQAICTEQGIEPHIVQSNHEGDLVDAIQGAYGTQDGILINATAYTHTSIAILDALKAVALPTVEVHLNDTNEQEEFRKQSYLCQACVATFCGLGFVGYKKGILRLAREMTKKKSANSPPNNQEG